MVSRRKTKWLGWLQPEDIDPELWERFRQYREKYFQYSKSLPVTGIAGTTGNWQEAHSCAGKDVPLTDEEFKIYRRIHEEAFRDIDEKYTWVPSRRNLT